MSNEMIDHGAGNLGYLLKRAQHAFRMRMDEALRPLNVTAPQYSVLAALALEPGISNATLARAALVTAQSMLGIVANLEKLKLIARKADPNHGRILQSHLTSRGQLIVRRAHVIAAEVEKTMLADISAREAAALRDLLVRCAQNLDR